MQEQNFEKQVKQKMEELSVAPSAPVWMKVEEQIRQKRDRRRLFFWLFPIGFLFAGLVTFSVIRFSDNNVAVQPAPVKENNTIQKKTNNTFTPTETQINKEEISGNEILTTKEASHPNAKSIHYNGEAIVNPVRRRNNKSLTSNTEGETANAFINNTRSGNVVARTEKNEVTAQQDPPERETKLSQNSITANTVSDTVESTIIKTTETEKQAAITEENKIPEVIKHVVKTKWTISPYLSIGVSSIQYGSGSMDKNLSQFSSSPATPGIGSGVPPMHAASEPTNGASFSLGAKFLKPLNKRLSISAGIGYYFASTHLRVGQTVRTDTVFGNNFLRSVTVDQYYTAGRNNKYTNSYHFVEIPLGINWKVSKKIPLELETGISIAQLIASNALTYDGNGNYYRNNRLLYNTHFTLNGALTYRLFSVKEKSFSAGPYFKYHLTQLEKSNSGQYLFSAGIGMKIQF
jgi:hypothetical protein